MTVHVLEDDPGVCDSLVVFLRGMGLDVVAYPDAETFFRAEPPAPEDTIIVDLLLPGISGAKVIRWLQGLAKPPRVIAITGQPQSAIEKQVRDLGQVEILRKPLTSATISSIV